MFMSDDRILTLMCQIAFCGLGAVEVSHSFVVIRAVFG